MKTIEYNDWVITFDSNNPRYETIKDNHRCIIYQDLKKKRFIKCYHDSLSQGHNDFLIEILSDPKFQRRFCPHLLYIIINTENNILKGYIMEAGRTLNTFELIEYMGVFKTIWKQYMENYCFIYNDIKPNNLIYAKGKIGLIDLEALKPITKDSPVIDFNDKNQQIKIEKFRISWYYQWAQKIQSNLMANYLN